MHHSALKQIRELVRLGQYVLTVHADEEADEDGLSILDIEGAILTGAIVERQKDRLTGEWKYVVRGKALDDRDAFVVLKFGLVSRLYILTVYAD